MTGHGASGQGTAGSGFDGNSLSYPAVPFGGNDFHQPYCEINNYNDANEVMMVMVVENIMIAHTKKIACCSSTPVMSYGAYK